MDNPNADCHYERDSRDYYVGQLFQKKKQLKFQQDCFKLPLPEAFYTEEKWEISQLLQLKNELNEVKGLLDPLDLVAWHRHTRVMNNAAGILPTLRQEFNPEFCSWAWSKFTECLHSYPVIPRVVVDMYTQGYYSYQMNSVHLCEVPGAFISATNHYLVQTMPDIKWNWLATSLCPYFEGNDVGEMINEDMLILNSWKNWTFLEDGTGNLLRKENIRYLSEVEVKTRMIDVHLVTADGSIDCQHNPAEQEDLVTHLHLAEIVAALKILTPGGSFVLKIFTFLECETICHLYLLACTFREVHLYKPVTSKEGNSEVYVISTGYLGNEQFKIELDALLTTLDNYDTTHTKALFPFSKINPEFLSRIDTAAKFFTQTQIEVIHRNFNAFLPFPASSKYYRKLKSVQMVVTQRYLEKFPMVRLYSNQSLFKGIKYRGTLSSLHMEPAFEVAATFQERTSERNEPLNLIRQNVERYMSFLHTDQLNVKLKHYKVRISLQRGRPYTNILSSRFCYSRLLHLRRELRQILQSRQSEEIPWLLNSDQHQCSTDEVEKQIENLTGSGGSEFRMVARNLCFHETPTDFLCRNDIDMTRTNLAELLSVLQLLQVGESLFLCEYPLLTRLHIGLIFIASQLFSQVRILLDKTHDFRGIYLFSFQGWKSFSQINLKCDLALLSTYLKEEESLDRNVVEVVSMRHLCTCTTPYWEHISTYNTFHLVTFMQKLMSYEG